MNIREFALRCGVSSAAVSRILNNEQKNSQASRETYERVRKMANELGFKPNYAARSLHTQKSQCIGVVIGFPTFVNSTTMVKGISEVANAKGLFMAVAGCGNDMKKEAETFERMLYRGVDAIVWHPTHQKENYSTSHVEKVLHKCRRKIPIVCLSYNQLPGIFKFTANGAEDATAAASRQLQIGCKKFCILRHSHTVPLNIVGNDAYRQTLLEHGIPPEHISTVVVNKASTHWEQLRHVDGVWVSYATLLHAALPCLKHVCDMKSLHIDTQTYWEDLAIQRWTHQHMEGGFESLFASLQYHVLDATQVARRGTEIVIEAMKNPELTPFIEEVRWQLWTPPQGEHGHHNDCLCPSGTQSVPLSFPLPDLL